MGKLVADFTMSLDGFIAGPNDDIQALLGWYYSGDTEVPVQDGKMVFKLSRASAVVFQAAISRAGAVVTGRRDFVVATPDVTHLRYRVLKYNTFAKMRENRSS